MQKTFEPKKFFSIDRVFRNETIDATHLAEFHQIEVLHVSFICLMMALISFYDTNMHSFQPRTIQLYICAVFQCPVLITRVWWQIGIYLSVI